MKIRMDDLYTVYMILKPMFSEKMTPQSAMNVLNITDAVEALLKSNCRTDVKTITESSFDKNKMVDNTTLPVVSLEQLGNMKLTPDEMNAFRRVFGFKPSGGSRLVE